VETVAFYYYKGGVGRSLLLASAARFLANLGKGVVALDFDFEAPGLHYKLGVDQGSGSPTFTGGAVPYLIATAEGAASPPPLIEHLISVTLAADARGWLWLMPAGPAPHKTYWAAFKDLGENLRLGDASGRGLMALLDLRARIQDELKPDYLLIDARTGVTEIGSLATTILADTVVCMFVGNRESLDGTLAVIEALKSAPRLASQNPIRVVPILSRTMMLDISLRDSVQRSLKDLTLFVLPHDPLATAEHLGSSPLLMAYLELFRELFPSAT
jgi:MinD-like ATPase involved in chromosome partitioning or flagellar assembly